MASLVPIGIEAAEKYITPENVAKLRDYLAEQFGLTADADYAGIWELLAIAYGSGLLKDAVLFIKGLYVLEAQISGLVETLNKFYQGEIDALSKGAKIIAGSNPGNTVNPNDPAAEQASIECAKRGGFMLFGKCVKL